MAMAKRVIKSRSAALEAVRESGQALKTVSDQLRGDRKVVLEAIRQNARALQFASDELRGDREIVLEAVRQVGQTLRFAAQPLRADRELALEAVRRDGMALGSASEELRADRSLVLEAVRSKPIALGEACEDLRADREVVLEAVARDGTSFEYASERLRGDRLTVLEAVAADARALDFAAEALQADRGFLREALTRNGQLLRLLETASRCEDRELVLAAVGQNGLALEHAAEDLRADREVVLEAVRQDGAALQHACDELRGDHGVVLEAVRQSRAALNYAAEELLDDRQIVAEAALAEWDLSQREDDGSDPQGPVFSWGQEEVEELELCRDANRLFRQGSYEEARRGYTQVLALETDSAGILSNRAAAHLMLGDFRQALEDASSAVARAPLNVRAQARCARCLLLLDRLQEATDFCESHAWRLPGQYEERRALAPLLNTSSRIRQHLESIHRIDELLGDRSKARTQQSVAACISSVERMLMLLTQVESTSPWGRRLRLAAVQALLLPQAEHSQELQRDWAQSALQHALQLVEEDPAEPLGRYWHARSLLGLGRRGEAREVLCAAVTAVAAGHAPSEELLDGMQVAEAERQQGGAALERKEHAAAHQHFNAAVAADRDHPDPDFAASLLCSRSTALLRQGQPQQALDDACEALSLAPGYTKARFHRGVALFELEKYEEALADFTEVAKRAPSFSGISQWKIRARTWAKKKPKTNHYAVLGTVASADAAEIKQAYKAAALKWHPDKNPERREEAECKFKEVSQAFGVLSDPKKRREYDSTGRVCDPKPADPSKAGPGFGFGPFGSSGSFGARGRGFAGSRSGRGYQRGPSQFWH